MRGLEELRVLRDFVALEEADLVRVRAAPLFPRELLPPEDFARERLFEFAEAPLDDLLLDFREAFLVVAILIPSSSGMAPP